MRDMKRLTAVLLSLPFFLMLAACLSDSDSNMPSDEELSGPEWQPLFNGEDLSGWAVKADGADAVWSVKNGVIDCDPRIQPSGDKSLWSDQEFGDFQLYVEWRIKETKGEYMMPTILPDGTYERDENGEVIETPRPNADSGIYLRGSSKAQVNIWCWPIGSGEVYGYRTDESMPADVRAGVTPDVNADNPVGEWNKFLITMEGEELTVVLNGQTVIESVPLPGVPESGPLALQHHGGYNEETGEWSPASSLVQFRDIYVKEL